MHRLFVALRPPASVRDALIDLMDGVPGARWQDDEQLHLTVRFIGAVDRPVAEDIATALSRIAAPAPQVELSSVGRFHQRGHGGALWAGVAPHDALAHLHRKVDQALVRAGLPPEGRAYLPHITVARISRAAHTELEIAAWLARHAALASMPFSLNHLILYESTLGHEGAQYESVARWPLA